MSSYTKLNKQFDVVIARNRRFSCSEQGCSNLKWYLQDIPTLKFEYLGNNVVVMNGSYPSTENTRIYKYLRLEELNHEIAKLQTLKDKMLTELGLNHA
jgi:hypothetical protein